MLHPLRCTDHQPIAVMHTVALGHDIPLPPHTHPAQGLAYSQCEGDEVEDLYVLLAYAKQQMPDIQAVASGAIASDYQRLRVENVCARLGLVSLAYLWHQPQDQLLQ
jgi:diphthine-ammonia ligase